MRESSTLPLQESVLSDLDPATRAALIEYEISKDSVVKRTNKSNPLSI